MDDLGESLSRLAVLARPMIRLLITLRMKQDGHIWMGGMKIFGTSMRHRSSV
jgi:hypothetical protein